MKPPLRLGTRTQWGHIGAVGTTGGERYYWMVDARGDVSMMPAFVVEYEELASEAVRAPRGDAGETPG